MGLVGSAPNQVPTNGDLGPLAFRDENPAGAVVGTTATQTLANKNLANPVINSGTANGVAYLDGSKVLTAGSGLTLDASGHLRLASGGIQFNGDTAEANALDDYEEGTFTPTIIGATTAGVGTYTSQAGRYTKVGRLVCFHISLVWTDHTGTGNLTVAGLPFVTANTSSLVPVPNAIVSNISYSGQLGLAINFNSTTISLYAQVSNTALASVPIDTTGALYVSGSYEV